MPGLGGVPVKIESLRVQGGLIALLQALLLTNTVTPIAIDGRADAALAALGATRWATRSAGWKAGRVAA
jgi:hypothetical protein